MLPLVIRSGWRLSIAAALITFFAGSVYFFANNRSEAFPAMPAEQRAYWEWVSSINKGGDDAIASGFTLLEQHPELQGLYIRLAQMCVELDQTADCASRLQSVSPLSTLPALYRDAAVATLAEGAAASWLRIAASPELDPAGARLVVDNIRRARNDALLYQIEGVWSGSLAADSSRTGAAFGLGYAAVLRSEWDRATPLLRHVTKISPRDAHAYRELGRMYFFTGDFVGFESALAAGIERARRSHDLEQELILRGNLGLGYLQWKGDLEKAAEMFETALERSRLLSMGEAEGFNLYRLANVRGPQHRYEEAIELLDAAEEKYRIHVPERIAEVHVLRGQLLNSTYRYREAITHLEKALESSESSGDVPSHVQALIALAHAEAELAVYTDAQAHGHAALELASNYDLIDYALAARSILGDIELRQGNHELARAYYADGLALAKETENVAREREMVEQLGIASLQVGDVGQAHAYFRDLLRLVEESESSLELTRSLYWIGITYAEYGNFREALRYLNAAEKTLPDEDASFVDLSIQRMKGAALQNLERHEEARRTLESALERAYGNTERIYALDVLLGHVLIEQGHYRDALRHFERAEAIEDNWQWSATHWYALHGKALAHWGLGHQRAAERYFKEAVAIIEALRDNLRHPEDRAYFIGDKVDVYDSYSLFLEEAGRTGEAFAVKERVRSRTLVDLLFTAGRRGNGSTEVDLRTRMRALEGELTRNEVGVDAGASTDIYRTSRATYIRRERLRADSVYRAVEKGLFGGEQIQSVAPVAVDYVQALLGEKDALIAFNLRKRSGAPSTAYVVLNDRVVHVPLAVQASEVAEAVRFLRDAVSSKGEFAPAARRLHRDLIEPIRSVLPPSIQHLHIVPEAILHYLPFAALIDEQGRFLVERFTLSVTPSATALKLSREMNPRRWSSMLLLADPDSRLPGARREVIGIADQARDLRHVLIGADASQEGLLAAAGRYDILHFATHGKFISREPWNSYLELYGDALTVEEIGSLDLNAYLVTLSACETALSSGLTADIPAGDEWVGLNQAFLAAGTPTVMASLWSIDDAASSRFMVGFYDMLGPEGKAAALARMQHAFLKDPATSHPFYWAAFTVIGDPM